MNMTISIQPSFTRNETRVINKLINFIYKNNKDNKFYFKYIDYLEELYTKWTIYPNNCNMDSEMFVFLHLILELYLESDIWDKVLTNSQYHDAYNLYEKMNDIRNEYNFITMYNNMLCQDIINDMVIM